jgi:hypothetical protein
MTDEQLHKMTYEELGEKIKRCREKIEEAPNAANAYNTLINISRLEHERVRRLARDEGTKSVEKSFEQFNSESEIAELRKRIAELEASNNELLLRCHALFSLLPSETKIGDIQQAVAKLKGETR